MADMTPPGPSGRGVFGRPLLRALTAENQTFHSGFNFHGQGRVSLAVDAMVSLDGVPDLVASVVLEHFPYCLQPEYMEPGTSLRWLDFFECYHGLGNVSRAVDTVPRRIHALVLVCVVSFVLESHLFWDISGRIPRC